MIRDITIDELFNDEIFKSERLRTIILICLLGLEALALFVIYLFYSEEYLEMFDTHIALYAVLIFTVIIIVYESLIHILVGKNNKGFLMNRKIFGYFHSISEVTILSLLLIFIIEYSHQTNILHAPISLTYFVFIVLSTLKLDFKLSVFVGLLAALEYILIYVYYSSNFIVIEFEQLYHGLTGVYYLGQGLIMAITGIAAGFVADLIRKKMIVSWNNINEKNEIIDLFGQQISTQIADNIIKNHNELSGIRKKVCIMFLDLRDFTPFVERNKPEVVVSYLNSLFSFMIDIVQANHGVINQFLGDGFMATFGAPVGLENSSQNATDASIQIIKKVAIEVKKGNIPDTHIGIGLHYDEAITGNIGSFKRKQYSITGKVVIMASRIEQLNKKYKTQLLISQDVFNQLNKLTKKTFIKIGSSYIKGTNSDVILYKFNINNI